MAKEMIEKSEINILNQSMKTFLRSQKKAAKVKDRGDQDKYLRRQRISQRKSNVSFKYYT